jgi:hypothetical protein
MFPSDDLHLRRLASLRRVAVGRLPRVHRYYQDAVTSDLPSRSTCAERYLNLSNARISLSRAAGVPHTSLELFIRFSAGCFSQETIGSLAFLGSLLRLCPALRPRPSRPARQLQRCGVAPVGTTTKASASGTFEAQSRGFDAHCLRFAVRIAPPHARLVSGRLPSATGRASHPQGSVKRFPLPLSFTSASSSSKLRDTRHLFSNPPDREEASYSEAAPKQVEHFQPK